MRIPGYNKRFQPPAPFIRITVESKSQRIKRPLHFHIDTGASVTALLDKDTSYLGIDVEKLKRAERNIGGLSGLINTYVIEATALFLRVEMEKLLKKSCAYSLVHTIYRNFPRARLNYKPTITLENGLTELAEWAQTHDWGAVDLFEKTLKELKERKLAT